MKTLPLRGGPQSARERLATRARVDKDYDNDYDKGNSRHHALVIGPVDECPLCARHPGDWPITPIARPAWSSTSRGWCRRFDIALAAEEALQQLDRGGGEPVRVER